MKKLNTIILLLLPMPLLAQVCNDAIPRNAFDARYEVDLADPRIVTDTATGLQWQRCNLGFVLDDNDGDPNYATHSCNSPEENTDGDDVFIDEVFLWSGAVEAAADEGDGWRLPNIKELTSLLEVACHSPAINSSIFPGTAELRYWSNTLGNVGDDSLVWTIDFSDGQSNLVAKGTRLPVRLVRD